MPPSQSHASSQVSLPSRKHCMTSLLYLPHIYTHSVLFSLTANFPFSHLPPASRQISVLSSNITVYGRWLHLCPSTQQPAVGLHAEKEWESPLFLTQLQQQLYPIWALHITLVPGNKYVQIRSSGILSLPKLVSNNLVHAYTGTNICTKSSSSQLPSSSSILCISWFTNCPPSFSTRFLHSLVRSHLCLNSLQV